MTIKGSTERWRDRLAVKAADVSDVSDRGRFVSEVSSAVANLKHDNIADLVRLLLDSGAWRDYTYPNGDHYEFRAREFDYFLAQIDVDPRLVRDAATHTDDQELRALLVEVSLDKPGEDRRSVEDIVVAYPSLKPWLDKYGIRVLGPKVAYESPQAVKRIAQGKTAKPRRYQWQVERFAEEKPSDDVFVELIVARLVRDGLAGKVAEALAKDVTLSRESVTSCPVCGGPLKGRQKTCSGACREKLRRSRKAT